MSASCEVTAGKSLLRDYIGATIGFEDIGRLTRKSHKSLMRIFSPKEDPKPATCSRCSVVSEGATGFTSRCGLSGRVGQSQAAHGE